MFVSLSRLKASHVLASVSSEHEGKALDDYVEEAIDITSNTADKNIVPKARLSGVNFHYKSGFHALKDISMDVHSKKITALIGPSGCGKSTLLRCFNRMHDLYPGNVYQGSITLYPQGWNLIDKKANPMEVRLSVGMVFQRPNPFPKSVYENVASGLRIRGIRDRATLNEKIESALRNAALWDEVKDRLSSPASALSGGQQQRLCIARALAPEPDLILFDEPTSALDPVATAKIEELIVALGKNITVVIVTHNMQQASRVSDYTAFMYMGTLVEFGATSDLFTNPRKKQTEQYITGRYG